MGEFSLTHILIVLILFLVFFGPKRLPQMGQSLGEAIRGFKDAMNADPNKDKGQNPTQQSAQPSTHQATHSAPPPAAQPEALHEAPQQGAGTGTAAHASEKDPTRQS